MKEYEYLQPSTAQPMRFDVLSRKFKIELIEPAAESYSRRWILTSFVQKSIGSTKEEIEKDFEKL